MDDSKLGTEFRLALGTDYETRVKSQELNVGYDPLAAKWELVIRYNGDLERAADRVGFSYTKLLNGYAIIEISEADIENLTALPEIIFVEKPKQIFMERSVEITGYDESCMDTAGMPYGLLTGKGVFAAVLDSGIDFSHPVFRREDGSLKIARFWNQSADGTPPEGYSFGAEYTREDMESGYADDKNDVSGHGTAVAGIIASCVPDAELIVVKLKDSNVTGYSRTTSLIYAVDYVVRTVAQTLRPLVINISYGNNYGDHAGNSILEAYLSSLNGTARLLIAVGTGNDGDTARHQRLFLRTNETAQVLFQASAYGTGTNLQIWYSYNDHMEFTLITPNGERIGPFFVRQSVAEYRLRDMTVLVILGYPSPINRKQEIYMSFVPNDTYITPGVYTVVINAGETIDRTVDMWLPVASGTSSTVRFLSPDADTTLTIPSTAKSVLSVGAYDTATERYAGFSGRGYTADGTVKPEISAPGVNILAASAGGGYAPVSGTSFAAPFASAGAAMLMEWGITDGNDPYLYGEKLKAYLMRGARRLSGELRLPNEKLGYGALCVRSSIPS